MSELIKQRENEKQTAEFAQNVSNKDLISRKAVIDALQKEINKGKPPFDDVIGSIRCGVRLARNIIEDLPSAQPEQDAEFWRKRTEEYRNQCIALTVNMTKGVKFDTLGFNEDGLVFKRGQPEQRWIPCSEKLPEDYDDVLVWFEYFRYGNYNCIYQTYGIGDYSRMSCSWMINHESGWHKLRVIAWMPLPEPYREEGKQDG